MTDVFRLAVNSHLDRCGSCNRYNTSIVYNKTVTHILLNEGAVRLLTKAAQRLPFNVHSYFKP